MTILIVVPYHFPRCKFNLRNSVPVQICIFFKDCADLSRSTVTNLKKSAKSFRIMEMSSCGHLTSIPERKITWYKNMNANQCFVHCTFNDKASSQQNCLKTDFNTTQTTSPPTQYFWQVLPILCPMAQVVEYYYNYDLYGRCYF